MAVQRILVGNHPSQAFNIQLGGQLWRMKLRWSPLAEGWYLSISDTSGNGIIHGVRLTENRRLLQGYKNTFIGDIWVNGDGAPGRRAWNTTHQLLWTDE